MRKETINTFSDGMSLDLNPLGTPAKTLTNCLNGTLITYNGNELTLQNDMGNVPVGTAELPKGYVPVGMKEYGGIIYVASYNPETKKGQLGCFPSPQQIYTSEAAQTVLDINIQDLFIEFFEDCNTNIKNIPVIQSNEYKEEIFKDPITQEARIFSSGDTFIIKTNNPFSDILRKAIDEQVITLKLFIIPINGDSPIDITESLKTYPDSWNVPLWIYQNTENIPFETLLNNHRELLQEYRGPQGTLQIVIEFNTFELFNLYRIFSNLNNDFSVEFIGEAFIDEVKSRWSLTPFELIGNINEEGHNLSAIEECGFQRALPDLVAYTQKHTIPESGTLYYDLMPACIYGALKLQNNSFLKSGELTRQGVQDAHHRITNWNFEINSDSAIIHWTYTLFDTDPSIDHMRFVFIPLNEVLDQGGYSKQQINQLYVTDQTIYEPTNPNIYTINKLYYSGDFEDKIILDDVHLMHNYIYLCRLDIIYSQNGAMHVENGHDYKLLYTGTFFNDKDVGQFNNDNRPEVIPDINLEVEQTYTIKKFTYTTLLENETGHVVETAPKEIVTANDVMFLANNERYYRKIVGIILNVDCEVTSTISIKDEELVQYGEENMPFRPSFAGRISAEETLNKCANSDGVITCKVKSETNYNYEGDGDSEVQQKLKQYVEKETIKDWDSSITQNLNGAYITYKKQGNTYQNKSTISIHRGIVSRMGQEDFYTVLQEGLFPVYEPDDVLYNERLFGFNVDEDGNLQNIIGGENFMGLSLWLAKNRKLDASTSVKTSMLEVERSYGKKTALSRYDFKGDAQTPYHYGSYISEGVGIVNYGSEGTSRIEAMQKCNYAPIQILASNEYERVWDKSYWDGDVDSRICNLMVLPHSEFGENLLDTFDVDREGDGREKHYGWAAFEVRDKFIEGDKNNVGYKSRDLFKASKGNSRCMYILWRSQYGYQIMNVATPLDIESNQELSEIVTVKPNSSGKLKVSWDRGGTDNIKEQYPAAETHLRADHMLFCLLSQILITKRKTANLLLNAPDVSQMYSTIGFKNKGLLKVQNIADPIVILSDKNIEDALSWILNNQVLNSADNFIPKFKATEYLDGYIECGGKVNTNSNKFGFTNLDNLFYAEGIPEFSTVDAEQRINIYPGKIEKVFGQYLCQVQKDRFGIYQVNEELLKDMNGQKKFYKIFLPTIHSHTNKEGAKYNCTNIETYKENLEGLAYNDMLFPLTRVYKEQGKAIDQLNSQEDLESPFFNLLYYNSIDLNYEFEDQVVVQDTFGCSQAPIDYCHGFAFTTLFGDQSRYLDSGVYLRNVQNYTEFSGVDANPGYFGWFSSCHDIFNQDRKVWPQKVLINSNSTQFKLGTKDWATTKIDISVDRSNTNSNDENEEQD